MDRTLSAVIVGAGIGGLTLAHALTQRGMAVTLVERADTLSEIGAGLSVWENGLDAASAIGLRGEIEAAGRAWSSYEIQRSGRASKRRNNRLLSRGGDVSPIMIGRGRLFGVLRDALPSAVEIVTGFAVEAVEGGTVRSVDGRALRGDVVIGADGVNSVVRKALTDRTPRFCKQVCFRGIGRLPDGDFPDAVEAFDRRHHRFGYFRLPGDDVYWFDMVDSEAPTGRLADHLDAIRAMGPAVSALVDSTPPDSVLCHPIEEMRPVAEVTPTVALLGDAAHPMQPSLGQGACLAMEDAVVLAHCLHVDRHEPERALRRYVAARKWRWRVYYELCRQLGTGALYKGLLGRKLGIARMVHAPDTMLSVFGKRIMRFNAPTSLTRR